MHWLTLHKYTYQCHPKSECIQSFSSSLSQLSWLVSAYAAQNFSFLLWPTHYQEQSLNPHKGRVFLLQNHTDWLWGLPCFPFDGYPEVKQPESEVDNSPPTSAEVKDECSYTSTTIKCFMVWTEQLYLLF